MPIYKGTIHAQEQFMYYRVKGSGNVERYLEVCREHPDGYDVIITTIGDNYREANEEFIDTHLFESCLRTRYLTAVDEAVVLRSEAAGV